MRILITGSTGFVGRHLQTYLNAVHPDAELHGTKYDLSEQSPNGQITLHALDLRDDAGCVDILRAVRPDQIYHLAAQSSPRRSFEIPWETIEHNVLAQLNVFQACLRTQLQPRILVVSSADIYGHVQPDEIPISEDAPLRPGNPYSVSKATQDLLALQYHISYKLPIVRVRPFNHIGPGQRLGFVATDFASQIAAIEQGQCEPQIQVGNLDAARDFTDVRDIVRAYHLVMTSGVPGQVYNVASGVARTVESLLRTLLSLSTATIGVKRDPARMLPSDVPIVCGDSRRLRELTNWQPQIPFEHTLRDILDDWRTRVQRST